MADYKFPATAGQGVDVYVPDSGGDLTNREFFNTIGTKRWLRPPQGTWPGPGPWAPIDPTGHGTCLADKVAGYNWGVAKNANLIFLRLPFTDDDEIFNSGMLLVFAMMTTDIDARTADARRRQVPRKLPVVSISWGTKTGLTRQFKRLLLQAIRNLMSRGAVVVMASGPANVSHLPILTHLLTRF